VSCAAIVLFAAPAAATIWIVDPAGPIPLIQQAIAGASAGDIVRVRPGTYHERLTLRDGVSIVAETAGTVTVDAESEGSVVTAIGTGATTLVAGVWFRNGSALAGGGLYALAASPIFTDCTFESNAAVLGGGVYARDASQVRFVRCIFGDNDASAGGGLYLDFSRVIATDCYVYGNSALDGSAISANNAAESEFTDALIYANHVFEGATIAINDASPKFVTCTIAANLGGVATIGTRSSGSRIERCIVAFNGAIAFGCSGSNALWVDCSLVFRNNGGDAICNGDRGTNLHVDPWFCDAAHYGFGLAANSPAATGTCGLIGALPVACPAQGVASPLAQRDWSDVKRLYGR
jgi:hypothetical protein